jgi:hypothetical protein
LEQRRLHADQRLGRLRGYTAPAGQTLRVDDVVVRKYVDPEPTAPYGAEDRY